MAYLDRLIFVYLHNYMFPRSSSDYSTDVEGFTRLFLMADD